VLCEASLCLLPVPRQQPRAQAPGDLHQFWLALYRQGGFSRLAIQCVDQLSRNDGGSAAARDGKGLAKHWAPNLTRSWGHRGEVEDAREIVCR
jgi:hypothetical protein